MAKKTIAQLEAELKEAQARYKTAEERAAELELAKAATPATAQEEGEIIPKITVEEHEKELAELQDQLEEAQTELSNYRASEDTIKKLEDAVANMKNGKALLFKKLSLALAEVKRIPKSGWNEHFKYKFAQEGDILDGIRPILSDVGLAIWTSVDHQERTLTDLHDKFNPNNPDKTKKRWMTKVKMRFTVACTDTGESIESTYFGEGEDESDKGLYKAYTGATKYFLSKTFLISSGDILIDNEPSDPEADTHRQPDQYSKQPTNYKNNSNTYKSNKNTSNQASNPNKGQSQQGSVLDEPQGGNGGTISKDDLIALWTTLAGNSDEFEAFYLKQVKKGAKHSIIANFLNDKITEKRDKGELPSQQESTETKKEESTTKQEESKKNPDDMTPQEYLEYVENNVPFPLTDSEKAEILANAEKGERNYTS